MVGDKTHVSILIDKGALACELDVELVVAEPDDKGCAQTKTCSHITFD